MSIKATFKAEACNLSQNMQFPVKYADAFYVSSKLAVIILG